MFPNQEKITFVLLPGLNGTDGLFSDFMALAPLGTHLVALSYPVDQELGYKELTDWICEQLSKISGKLVLLGESFSGPLSLFVENRISERVVAVILTASFISPPRAEFFKLLPWHTAFALAKPLYSLRILLSDNSKSTSILKAIAIEKQKVHPRVLSHRVKQTLSVNAGEALIACKAPILYLQASKDLIVPKSALTEILRLASSVSVVEIPTQHFLLQSMPAEAWSAITQFMDTILKPTAHQSMSHGREIFP
jgi:pimeloyl-ACP methyl ester carboxylesterase